MTKINKILLVGLGSIGKRHLSNIQQLMPKAEVLILRSRSNNKPVDGCNVATHIDEALRFCPDIAIICNPSSFHLGVATKLAQIGVHLFIEKPLSNNSSGIDKLSSIALDKNVKIMVGYNLRFNKSLQKFKTLIQSNKYGRVLCVSAQVGQYLPDWRPNVDYRDTVSASSKLGGGVLLELSHELDYLTWIFGEVEYVSGSLLKVSDLEIDVEDLALLNFGFKQENYKFPCSVHLDFLQRKPHRSCMAICEQASVKWDAIQDCIIVSDSAGSDLKLDYIEDKNNTYKHEILHFVDCVINDKQLLIPIEDGTRVLKLIDAIRLSSSLSKVVYL